jgi:hypothetical protein
VTVTVVLAGNEAAEPTTELPATTGVNTPVDVDDTTVRLAETTSVSKKFAALLGPALKIVMA